MIGGGIGGAQFKLAPEAKEPDVPKQLPDPGPPTCCPKKSLAGSVPKLKPTALGVDVPLTASKPKPLKGPGVDGMELPALFNIGPNGSPKGCDLNSVIRRAAEPLNEELAPNSKTVSRIDPGWLTSDVTLL